MYVNRAVLVVTLFIAFGERINEMDFTLRPSDLFLLILLLGLIIHAYRNWFLEQWKELKRKKLRSNLIGLSWFEELRENSERKTSQMTLSLVFFV